MHGSVPAAPFCVTSIRVTRLRVWRRQPRVVQLLNAILSPKMRQKVKRNFERPPLPSDLVAKPNLRQCSTIKSELGKSESGPLAPWSR